MSHSSKLYFKRTTKNNRITMSYKIERKIVAVSQCNANSIFHSVVNLSSIKGLYELRLKITFTKRVIFINY